MAADRPGATSRPWLRSLGDAVLKSSTSATIARILDLHSDAVGIADIQLLGVAARPDVGLQPERFQLAEHGLCFAAIAGEGRHRVPCGVHIS